EAQGAQPPWLDADDHRARAAGMSLGGKVAVVTGAAGGIGRASACLLAARGASVVVSDVQQSVAETAELIRAAGGQAEAVVTDCATEAGAAAFTERAVEVFGRLDIVHANAGVSGPL